MARLRNLIVENIALVELGANQEAHIRLAKGTAEFANLTKHAAWLTTQTAQLRAATAALHAARRSTHPLERESDVSSYVAELRKALESGGSWNRRAIEVAVEEVAAEIFQRERSLTREKALAKGWSERLFPFRVHDANNPTFHQLWKNAPVMLDDPAVAKALADETDAWRELERLATDLRREHPELTPEAAIGKAMNLTEGRVAYRKYQAAQAARCGR